MSTPVTPTFTVRDIFDFRDRITQESASIDQAATDLEARRTRLNSAWAILATLTALQTGLEIPPVVAAGNAALDG